jgi:hypothetical protein
MWGLWLFFVVGAAETTCLERYDKCLVAISTADQATFCKALQMHCLSRAWFLATATPQPLPVPTKTIPPATTVLPKKETCDRYLLNSIHRDILVDLLLLALIASY